MTNLKTPGNRSAGMKTEAEVKSIDGRAGKSGKSSENAKSHTKANSNVGAGGGKKQERHH
jgi:hypothetical protein